MKKEPKITEQKAEFQKVGLMPPTNSFYLLLAAEIDHSPIRFFVTESREKRHLIEQSKKYCGHLETENEINSAVVFKGFFVPPGRGKFAEEQKTKVHLAKFDFVILIEAASQEKIDAIRNNGDFKAIENRIKTSSTYFYFTEAKNVKRIAPVNHAKQGVFLFNFFFADDTDQNLAVWEYTAGWFQQETGLDNSTVLLPISTQKSEYTIVNHWRWDNLRAILPSLIFKKSFRSYVLQNFYENKVAAIPILYKMA